jgi:uncharacterized repeat protein (TIGR01451 family)
MGHVLGLRQGGAECAVSRDFAIDPYDFGPSQDEALKDYIEAFSPVTSMLEGRIQKPELSVVKEVMPTPDVPLGGTVTYTVTLNNGGGIDATGVVTTDTLSPEVDFGEWLDQGSAMLPGSDVITWGPYTVATGMDYASSFTAALKTGTACYAAVVTNTVEFNSDSAGSGFSNDAVFTIEEGYKYIFLLLILRNS